MRRRTGVTVVAILRGLLPIVDPSRGCVSKPVTTSSWPAGRRTWPPSSATSWRAPLMGHDLVILGIAFLLAGCWPGRAPLRAPDHPPLHGRRHRRRARTRPGPALFDHPEELELLAAFGLIFLLFYLGIEFSIEDLTEGAARCWPRPGCTWP